MTWRRRKQIESGGHEFRDKAPEIFLLCPLHFPAMPLQLRGHCIPWVGTNMRSHSSL